MSKITKVLLKKIITMLLVFVMLFNFSGSLVYGLTELTQTRIDETIAIPPPMEEEQEPDIIGENVDARTANTKEFILSDGTFMIATYEMPVHYNADGTWKEIDNTLEEKAYKAEEAVLENKNNIYNIKFAKLAKQNSLMELKIGEHEIKWSLQGANKAEAKNITREIPEDKNETENDKKTKITKASSSIIYEDILKDTDIKYTTIGTTVKEDIILKTKEATENKLIFDLEIGKLEATLTKNTNEIGIYDPENPEKILYKINAPYMYDAILLNFSADIEIKLEKTENGYTMELIPDEKWLNDEERAYPITIDPTIDTTLDYNNIFDTFIYEGDTGNTGRGLAHILRIGNSWVSFGPFRSLVKFNLPVLSSGDQVVKAKLNLVRYPATSEWDPPAGMRQINVHKVTTDWTESGANWNNMANNYDSKVVDYVMYKYSGIESYMWDVTSIAKDWYTTGNNYGVMLKENIEQKYYYEDDVYFFSADVSSTYAYCRPLVVITYRNQTGLEDYLSYHTQSAGRAGTIYTNDYNGNLTLIHSDLSTPGINMPASVVHVYNTNDRAVDIGYGRGMRLNYSQTIEILNISGIEYAKYIDEDGTTQYFKKDGSINVYKHEYDAEWKLTLASNQFTMTDKEGYIRLFNKHQNGSNNWHIERIVEPDGSRVKFEIGYNSSNKFIIRTITDATGNAINFTYASNDLLTKMVDPVGRTINYTYDGSKRLTKITYWDNEESNYTYDSNNCLTKAMNIDGSSMNYIYHPGNTKRVSYLIKSSTIGESGDSLTINYKNSVTTFSDNQGYVSNIVFNNWGQVVSTSDFGKDAGGVNTVYGKNYLYGTSGNITNKLLSDGKVSAPIKSLLLNGSVEYDGYWRASHVNSTYPATISYTTEEKYIGNRSIKVVSSNNATESRYIQDLNIQSGKKYTLSAQVKTKNMGNGTGGAFLVLYYYISSRSGDEHI